MNKNLYLRVFAICAILIISLGVWVARFGWTHGQPFVVLVGVYLIGETTLMVLKLKKRLRKAESERREIDAKFVAAGHRPEDTTCDHSAWKALPSPRPRHCPKCSTCMWDAGD